MDIATLTTFLGWCTLFNLGLYLLWVSAWMLSPEMVYRTQTKLFDIPRATFEPLLYGFFAAYKLFFLFFNVVPYLVLLAMQ